MVALTNETQTMLSFQEYLNSIQLCIILLLLSYYYYIKKILLYLFYV